MTVSNRGRDRRRLALNSLSGVFKYLATVVVTFIMTPVVIHTLGDSKYGAWELILSVAGYISLLKLGTGTALVRFVSVSHGKDDQHEMKATISTSVAFFALIACATMVVFVFLSFSPDSILGEETGRINNARYIVLMVGGAAMVRILNEVNECVLMGLQRHYFLNFTGAAVGLLQAGLLYGLLTRFPEYGLEVISFVNLASAVLLALVYSTAVWRDRQAPAVSLTTISYANFRKLFSFGVKSTIMMVAARVQYTSVPIIITHMIGLASVIYFAIPNRLMGFAKDVTLAIGYPITPYIGAIIGTGKTEDVRGVWLNTSSFMQAISIPAPLIIFFFGTPFLGLWLGGEHVGEWRVVMNILLVGLLADALASNAYRILVAQARHGRCAVYWLILSFVALGLGILGAATMGVPGVAAGVTVATVAGSLMTIALACQATEVSFQEYVRATLQKLILPLIVLAGLLWWTSENLDSASYYQLLRNIAIPSVIYLLLLRFVAFRGHFSKPA